MWMPLAHWGGGGGAPWKENLLTNWIMKIIQLIYGIIFKHINERNQIVIAAFGLIRHLEKTWVKERDSFWRNAIFL
jgi:hypothetical protein